MNINAKYKIFNTILRNLVQQMKKIYYEPEYVSKFICDGPSCGGACCKDWQIEIDAKAANRYRDKDSNIADFKDGRYYINLNEKNACPFLTENCLCGLQLREGEPFLSGTCRTFPRRTYFIDDFCERTLSLACPLAAKLALSEQIKFKTTETDDETDMYNSNVPDDLLDYLVEVQMAGVKILQERRLTIDQRLIVLGFFLDKLDEIIIADNLEEIDKLTALYQSDDFIVKQAPLMLQNVQYDHEAYQKIMLEVFAKAEIITKPNLEARIEHADILENYLVNEFFGNIYPWRTKGAIAQNYGLFVLTYKILEALIGEGEPIEIVTWFSRNIDHDVEYYRWLQTKSGLDILKIMRFLHN